MTDQDGEVKRLASLPALACGTTERKAAVAFAPSRWPGLRFRVTMVDPADDNDPTFRVRGRVGGGMAWSSVKIDGVKIPGGCVVTEWT